MMTIKTKPLLIFAALTGFAALSILTACKPTEEVVVEITPTPTPTLPPEQQAAWDEWQISQHADTDDLEGLTTNTYCARCHSPTNWVYYTRLDDNQSIPEEAWGHIGCEVCHQMEERIAGADYYWYDNATTYYEVVGSPQELCERCHMDVEPYFHYGRDMGDEVHQDLTCTDCHDAHNPYANCGDCHEDISQARTMPSKEHVDLTDKSQCLACHPNGLDTHPMETQRQGERDCLVCHDYLANISAEQLPDVYHSRTHMHVDCVACHDGSGLQAGPTDDQLNWKAFRTVELVSGEVTRTYQSHSLTTDVKCTRCHFTDNPWGLPTLAAQ